LKVFGGTTEGMEGRELGEMEVSFFLSVNSMRSVVGSGF
jgi:hypothetical protein